MSVECAAPIADETLADYWTDDLAPPDAAAIEDHVFACSACARRLDAVASLGEGLASLARQGRISGVISHALLNRLQRDGVTVRLYTLSPGDTVPCAVFPGDDVVVVAMRADLSGVRTVTLRATGPGDVTVAEIADVPVSSAGDVLWATPGAVIRQMPSQHVHLTLRASDGTGVLGEYVLDHAGTS
jgi:hypothetical protein